MAVTVPQALLLYNARVHARADAIEAAEALLIVGERVVGVGSGERLRAGWPLPVEAIDLGGRSVFPGLCDAHLHLEKFARATAMVDCEVPTRDECLRRVAQRALSLPPQTWLLGHGWNQNDWGGHGSADELDGAAPDNPVYLTAKSLHAAWVNHAALRAASIGASTPNPEGGVIVRSATGEPSGILLEGAMALVFDRIPEPEPGVVADEISAAQSVLWSYGITGVHDFDGPRCLSALQMLRTGGRLRLHVLKSIPIDHLGEAASLGLRSGFGDDWLRLGHVKIFADGALGPRTAAMLAPYDGEPENFGMALIDREGVFEAGLRAAAAGFPLAIHAIGDRANHEVIEGLAALRRHETEHGLPRLNHRIEHLQLLHPDDVPRPAELGLVASMQPIHATSDMPMADRYWGDRVSHAYAWKAQLDHGARLAFGSDAPVESPNPFLGLHAAVTRQRADGSPGPDGWIPDQRLDLSAALRGFTSGPAETAGLADRLGRLEPGYYADLIVLDRNLFDLPPGEIRDVGPRATMVGGRWVYPAGGPDLSV